MRFSHPNRKKRPKPAILVIDDDARIRRLLDLMLRAEGYDVILADNGAMGVELFRREHKRVSLVLLDYEMPGMNGDEVFDALAVIRSNVKVVVSSGQSASEIMRRFTGRSVADILLKPFTPQSLTEKVRSVLAI